MEGSTSNRSLFQRIQEGASVKKGLPSVARPASSGSMGVHRGGGGNGKTRIIVPTKYKTKKNMASTKLRLLGTAHSISSSNIRSSQASNVVVKKSSNKIVKKKKKKKKKLGMKKSKGGTNLLSKKVKEEDAQRKKGEKLTVSSLFNRVH